jgi:tetratricopeptide (TPR) repeat protein
MRRTDVSKHGLSLPSHKTGGLGSVLVVFCLLPGPSAPAAVPTDNQAEAQRLFEKAQAAKARGDLQLAEQNYLEVIRLAPDLPNAYHNLGITYFTERKYGDAVAVLEKAVKLSPQSAPPHFMLGLSYYELYESQKAIESFRTAIRLNSSDTNALLYLGKSQIQAHDYVGAAETLEKLAKLKPDDPDVLYNLSVAHLKLMLGDVSRLSRVAPDSYQLWLLLAQEAEARGDNQSAIRDYQHALRLNPQGVGIHYALGSVLTKEGASVGAAQEFKKELELNSNDALALWKLGELTLRTDPPQALEYLRRSVSLSPDLPQAVLAYGRALARLGETERAVEQFRRAVRLAPEEDSVHYHLSRAYRLLGRNEEAKVEMAKFEELAKKKSERTREQARQLIELTREEQRAEGILEPGFDPSQDPTHH